MIVKKVSVIIPMYQSEAFVEQCVRSVLCQSYQDLEILVIDDGSTDGGPQICRQLCRQDERIRLLCQKQRGVSAARNRGMDMATGEYLFFLDSDDAIHPALIETLVTHMEACQAQFALCHMLKQNDDGMEQCETDGFPKEENPVWEIVEGPETENWFFLHNRYALLSMGGKMVRRDWVGKLRFDERLQNGEDTLFMYQVICRKARMVYLSAGWYYYRMYTESLTHSSGAVKSLHYTQVSRLIRNREYRKNRIAFAMHWEKLLLRQMEETARAMHGKKAGKDWRCLKKYASAEKKHPLFQKMASGTKLMFCLCFYCYPLYVPLHRLRPAVWEIRKRMAVK